MERQPRRTALRDLDEGTEVTFLAKVVSVDAEGKRSLLQFSDGSRAWISWEEYTLIAGSGDLAAYTDPGA